jgi:hypothetical protein
MVLQSHRAILVRIAHGILPRKGRSPGRSRDEPRGTLKGVPIKVRIGNSNALRDVRLLSICTFAEIMSRENLRADISQIEIPQSSSLLPYRLPPGPCGFGCGNGSASAGVAAMTAMARIAAIIFWLPIAIASKAHSPDLF